MKEIKEGMEELGDGWGGVQNECVSWASGEAFA